MSLVVISDVSISPEVLYQRSLNQSVHRADAVSVGMEPWMYRVPGGKRSA